MSHFAITFPLACVVGYIVLSEQRAGAFSAPPHPSAQGRSIDNVLGSCAAADWSNLLLLELSSCGACVAAEFSRCHENIEQFCTPQRALDRACASHSEPGMLRCVSMLVQKESYLERQAAL